MDCFSLDRMVPLIVKLLKIGVIFICFTIVFGNILSVFQEGDFYNAKLNEESQEVYELVLELLLIKFSAQITPYIFLKIFRVLLNRVQHAR